jgi:ATP-binding cassette subfamily B protein
VGPTDCGPAALATIARHYRRPISLPRLRDLTDTDRSGTSLRGLARAAEGLGFAARGVRADDAALPRIPLPALAHVKTADGAGHFVTVHRVTRGAVVVADPARGVEVVPRGEFVRSWTGALLLVAPQPGASPRPAEAGSRGRLPAMLAAHAPVLAEAFACALVMTALGVATSFFIQHLVDSVLVRGEARLLNALAVGMVLVALFRVLFAALRHYLLAHVGRQVDLALIAGYARHVLGLPLRFFETRRVGEILERVHDAAKVREAVGGATMTAVVDGFLVTLLLAVLWAYDPRLAAVVTAFVPLLAAVVAAQHPAARARANDAMEQAAGLAAHLVEDVSGVETVKAFGAERRRGEGCEARLVGFVRSVFALEMLGVGTGAASTLVTATAGVAVLWYGGHRVMAGELTVGQLLFFYSMLTSLLAPLERLAAVNLKVQEALVASGRLSQVMDLEPEVDPAATRVAFAGVRDAIELGGVTFRYGGRAPVLSGLDLRIPAGRVVAIVGESGSGKSTVLKLLMGFYAPTEGRVAFDGVDLRDLDLASLRSRVGLVAQDPFVFTGTVRENIAVGRPGASPAEVAAAARAAGLGEFIAALPDRYETVIGERGVNLSGGQRQRLAIARALLRRPDVLIFDEATSHLDTATERAIQESLRASLAGRTVVLVAHRLSTVREADLIYVLHQGRVVEEGTHRQLMALGGRYGSLWRSQADDAPDHRPPAGTVNHHRNDHREGVSRA